MLGTVLKFYAVISDLEVKVTVRSRSQTLKF